MIRSYQGLFWYWGSTAPSPGGAQTGGTRYRMGGRINYIVRSVLMMIGF